MKSRIIAAIWFAVTSITPLYAVNCKMIAVHDTYVSGLAEQTMKQGTVSDDVTEYVIDHKSGEKSFCLHGGFCYVINVKINGRPVDALKLTNCRVKADSGDDDGEFTLYSLETLPARSTAPRAQAESVKDVQGVGGRCQNHSQTNSGPMDEDIKGRAIRFHCDTAAISFMDNVNKRIAIRFFDSQRIKDGPGLGFIGEMQDDGKTLRVRSLEFIDLKSTAAPASDDSSCTIEFHDRTLSGIQCFAASQSSGYKRLALVDFVADPDQ